MTRLSLREKELIVKHLAPVANTIGAADSYADERNLYLRLVRSIQKEVRKRKSTNGVQNS